MDHMLTDDVLANAFALSVFRIFFEMTLICKICQGFLLQFYIK